MDFRLFSNLAITSIASGISSGATIITAVNAADFPQPSGGSYFEATLVGPPVGSTLTQEEIVKVVARSGNNLTVVRAQQGTTASAYPAGTALRLQLTAGFLNDAVSSIRDLATSVTNLGTSITNILNGNSKVGDADNLDGQSSAYFRNANNLNAGIVPTGRLSGTYNINITGSFPLGQATGTLSGSQVGQATEVQQGAVEFANDAETLAGTSRVRAVHPAGLKAALDAASAPDDNRVWTDTLRFTGTTYTNNTGRTIQVLILTFDSAIVECEGLRIVQNGGGGGNAIVVTFDVKNGSTYRLVSGSAVEWSELR